MLANFIFTGEENTINNKIIIENSAFNNINNINIENKIYNYIFNLF